MELLNEHKKTHKFSIDCNGYEGEFTAKYPSLMDRIKIGINRAKLLGNTESNVDVITSNIAYMLASLDVLLITKPKWFKIETFGDYEVLEKIFDCHMEWVTPFRADNESDNKGDSGTTGDAETLEDNEDVFSANK